MNNTFEKRVGLLRWLALFIVALIVIQASYKIIKSPFSKGDFEAFFNAAGLIVNQQNIYLTPTREVAQGGLFYLYLPLLAILFVPLTFLPIEASILIWNSLSAFLIFWTVKLFYETITGESYWALPIKSRWILTFFPILLTSPFILHHLSYGQANILILAITVFALSLIKKQREMTGGSFFGLAIVLKVIAAPFIVWFLSKKSWRVIIGITIGGIIGVIVIPSLVLGIELNLSYIDFWLRNIVLADDLGIAKVPLRVNLSLQAQLHRFFTPVSAFTYQNQSYSLTIFTLPLQTVQILGRSLQVLVLSTIVFYAVRYKNKSELVSKWGGVALTFALIPLFASTTQRHYFVMLLPTFVYAVYVWHCRKLKDKWFRGLLVTSFILMLATNKGIAGNLLSDVFTASGFNAYGTILLVLCIFRIARCLTDTDSV